MIEKIVHPSDRVFFTSDLHLGHENIIKFTGRPFRDANEMNEALIERWNARIGPEDPVYCLGDWFLGGSKRKFEWLLSRLNGRIYAIIGNHDSSKVLEALEQRCEWVRDYHVLHKGKQVYVLGHYPFRAWYGKSRKSINLHGHCHSRTPRPFGGNQIDVGVDSCRYEPYSLKDIELLSNSEWWGRIDTDPDYRD